MGSTLGMNNLGWLYQNGWGVVEDCVKARELYLKAAELGDKWAMFNLGMLYELGGDGVARDGTKAAEWDKKASDAGVRGMSVGFLRVFTREKRCPTCFKFRFVSSPLNTPIYP
jgi:TPR repeat protein